MPEYYMKKQLTFLKLKTLKMKMTKLRAAVKEALKEEEHEEHYTYKEQVWMQAFMNSCR